MNRKTLNSILLMVFVWIIFPIFANAQSRHRLNQNPAQQHIADSLQAIRTHRLDSLKEARNLLIDSIKKVQQHRIDSIQAIKTYRNSKRYKDSLSLINQHRKDSLLAIRKHILDSTKLARQHYTDSVTASRNHIMDSIKLARQHFKDSLTAYFDSVHVARAKALAKLNTERARRKRQFNGHTGLPEKPGLQGQHCSHSKTQKRQFNCNSETLYR